MGTKRPFAISAPDSRTPRLAPPRASDRRANSRRNVINSKPIWSKSKRSTRRFATSSNAPSTSSLDIRRLAHDRWVLRSSRRRPFYHRRRHGSDRRVNRCYGIRCQDVGCYWYPCRNNGVHDDGETMTSSTHLPADVFSSSPAAEKNTSNILHHAVPIDILSLFIAFLSCNYYFPFALSIRKYIYSDHLCRKWFHCPSACYSRALYEKE